MIRILLYVVIVLVPVQMGFAAADDGGNGWPCLGRPAVTLPGGEFGVGDLASGTAYLVGPDRRIAVPVKPAPRHFGAGTGLATVPSEVPPGRYGLVVSQASGEVERAGAVHILESPPESYTIALVRADGQGSLDAPLFSDDLMAAVASSAADLVFVVGTLTRDGTEASYQALATTFGAIAAPVVFCPDRGELARGVYRSIFGPPVYGFRFGEDGYLLLGPGPDHSDSGAEAQMGPIHQWRRALRSSRWSTGVAGRFGLDWMMRSQLILFEDDPLDYLIAGEVPSGIGERLPWGRTRLVPDPAVPPASLQVLVVQPSSITLREAAVLAGD